MAAVTSAAKSGDSRQYLAARADTPTARAASRKVSPQRMSVSSSEVVDATAVGRRVLTAEDAAEARGAIGAASADVITVTGTLTDGTNPVVFPTLVSAPEHEGREAFSEDGRDINEAPLWSIFWDGLYWVMTSSVGLSVQWTNLSQSTTVPLVGWIAEHPATGIPTLTRTRHTHSSADIRDATSTPSAGKVMLWPTTYKRHVQLDAKADGNVANQPTQVDFSSSNIPVAGLQFSQTGTKNSFCQFEVPDDWAGTDIVLEIDWLADSGNIGATNVKWVMQFIAVAEGESVNQAATAPTPVTVTGKSQWITVHSGFTIPAASIAKQDHVFVRFYRDNTVASNFTGTVTSTAYEMIYDSVGFPTSN